MCFGPERRLGITALLALGILEQIQAQGKTEPLLQLEHNSAEYLHTLLEAMRSVHILFCSIFLLIPFSLHLRLAFAGESHIQLL